MAGTTLGIPQRRPHAGAALAGFAFVLFAGQIYEGIAGRVAAEIELGEDRAVDVLALLRSMPRGRLVVTNLLYVTGTVVGLVLLVVPGVVFFTIYVPVITLISLEGRRIGEAFKRSRRLVRGSFWRVLLIVGLASSLPRSSIQGSERLRLKRQAARLLPTG